MTKKLDLIDREFGQLIVLNLDYIKNRNTFWRCKCSCGIEKTIRGSYLLNGHSSTCGCSKGTRPAILAAAIRVHHRQYKECPFDVFYKMSQMNCHYCGLSSSNLWTYKPRNFIFAYNGLDRVDSNLDHSYINNLVPCCKWCNTAKLYNTYDSFVNWIVSISNNTKNIKISDKHYEEIKNNKYLLGSAKQAWYDYKKELPLDKFINLSQSNCFYCNSAPKSVRNAYKYAKRVSEFAKLNGDFIYNGLDRVNNFLTHSENNVVPCCKICNFAKSNRTTEEFFIWINKLRNNLILKKIDKISINYFIDQYLFEIKNSPVISK